jgi:hypothetical protein
MLQRLIGVQHPVPRQAVVEKHIEDDPGIAPARQGKPRQRSIHQRVAIGEHVDAAMQLDGRFDLRIELPLQPSLDEIAIQTAEQLTGTLATEVKMCEIVHGRSLALPLIYTNVSL